MAKYVFENNRHNLNLSQFKYETHDEGDDYVRLTWEYLDADMIGLAPDLVELLKYDKDIQDDMCPIGGFYLYYKFENNKRILDYLCYSKGYEDKEVRIELNKAEQKLFQSLLDRY